MDRAEVIEALCKLASKVAETRFDWQAPADCLCTESESLHFQFSPAVVEFITVAVERKLKETRS